MYTSTITIYVADKLVEDSYGVLETKGYNNLKKYTEIVYSPSYNENDVALYGINISSMYKFLAKYDVDLSVDGGNGIWLSKPIPNAEGYYERPEFISNPIIRYNNITTFDAIKQQY